MGSSTISTNLPSGERPDTRSPFVRQWGLVQGIEFVAMAVSLMDARCSVDAFGDGAWCQLARVPPEPHRAAQFIDAEQVSQFVDQLVRRVLVYFRGISAFEVAHVARELHGRPLKPVADPEERDPLFSRVFGRLHHAARPARTEAPRHQNAVRPFE